MDVSGGAGPVLVTGGAGFIGGALCRLLVTSGVPVVNVDKLTYSANLASLRELENHPNYRFYQGDIADQPAMLEIMRRNGVTRIAHLAAETHVDRSIDGPAAFIDTNIVGTFRLLETATVYFRELAEAEKARFRFLHVSTDEVFGDLADADPSTEASTYRPSSPYAASKAAADHLARAWHRTFGLPVLLSNCSNNYGPYQFPEKLIPVTILNALAGRAVPVYGDGGQMRDWLYVEDHARALSLILDRGAVGETYLIGGRAERANLAVAQTICDIIDRERPLRAGRRRDLIRFVEDRPGHDRRYAVDPGKIEHALGWRPQNDFASGLDATVRWYLDNDWWWRPARDQAGVRLGTGG